MMIVDARYCFPLDNRWCLKANIQKEMIELAKERHMTFDKNSKTIVNSDKFYAFLSEVCFEYIFPGFRYAGGYNYDYTNGEMKVDIKTTLRKNQPKIEYSGKIPKYSVDRQKNTHYCFMSAIKVKKGYQVFICGLAEKEDVSSPHRLLKAGSEVYNNHYMKTDSYEFPYSETMREWEIING